MRNFLIYLFLGISLLACTQFFFGQVSPFDMQKVQELAQEKQVPEEQWDILDEEIISLYEQGVLSDILSNNFYIGLVIMLSGVGFIFVSIHLFIDKLFFKNFYESASLFDAVRRGFLVALTIGILLTMKIYNYETSMLYATPLAILCIEAFFATNLKIPVINFIERVRTESKMIKVEKPLLVIPDDIEYLEEEPE